MTYEIIESEGGTDLNLSSENTNLGYLVNLLENKFDNIVFYKENVPDNLGDAVDKELKLNRSDFELYLLRRKYDDLQEDMPSEPADMPDYFLKNSFGNVSKESLDKFSEEFEDKIVSGLFKLGYLYNGKSKEMTDCVYDALKAFAKYDESRELSGAIRLATKFYDKREEATKAIFGKFNDFFTSKDSNSEVLGFFLNSDVADVAELYKDKSPEIIACAFNSIRDAAYVCVGDKDRFGNPVNDQFLGMVDFAKAYHAKHEKIIRAVMGRSYPHINNWNNVTPFSMASTNLMTEETLAFADQLENRPDIMEPVFKFIVSKSTAIPRLYSEMIKDFSNKPDKKWYQYLYWQFMI